MLVLYHEFRLLVNFRNKIIFYGEELLAPRPTPKLEDHPLWAGHVARMGETRKACRILMGKPEGKRPLGRPRHRWMGNIKIHLRKIGWDGMDWIDLVQDRDQWRALVNMMMSLRVP
jgi:hypothetical protein